MRLDELRSKISESGKDDWEQIVCWGAGSGPSYLYDYTVWTGADGLGLEIEGHANIAVYRDDVNLRIAWGFDPDHHDHRDRLAFPWQENLADSGVRRFYSDVFWKGSLVDRMLMLSVDGGRAVLPLGDPKHERDDWQDPGDWVTDLVTEWEYRIWGAYYFRQNE